MDYDKRNKIHAMHRMYGPDPLGRICADCPHLVKRVRDKTYYKCVLYGASNSAATDWAKKWQACMLIDHSPEPDNFQPVVERLKHMPKEDEPLEGQMTIEDMINSNDK